MSRTLRRLAAAAGALLALALLGAALLAVVELRIPADPWRARIAAALADALGCRVALDGRLALLSGPRPGVDAASVSVYECAVADDARVALEGVTVRARLWPLLRGEVRGVEASAQRAELAVPKQFRARPRTAKRAPGGRALDIERVRIASLGVALPRADGTALRVAVEALEASAPAGAPTAVNAHGTFRAEPWRSTVTAPPLDALLDGAAAARMEVSASYAGADLEARGTVRRDPVAVEADLALRTQAAERLVAALGGPAPARGAFALRSRVAWSGERVELAALALESAALDLQGSAHVDWSGERPMLGADARVSRLDAAALAKWRGKADPPVPLAATIERVAAALSRADAEVKLAIDAVANGPVPATGLAFEARLAGGRLLATGTGVVDAAPGEMRLEADARGPLAVDARATVKRLPRETLGRAAGAAALDPRVGALTATLRARGPDAAHLLRSAETRFVASELRLALPIAGERIEARLRTAELDARAERSLRARAAGTLGGQPVTLEVSGASAAALVDGRPWPVQVRARLADARLDARGEIATESGERHARLAVDFAAARLDRLTALLPRAPLPALRAALRGSVDFGGEAWHIAADSLAVGGSRGEGAVRSARKVATGPAPLRITLALANLDADELVGSLPARAAPEPATARARPPVDLDLALDARRATARGIALDALSLRSGMRGGRITGAPFAFGASGAKVEGVLDVDLSGDTPRYGVKAAASSVDVARIVAHVAERRIALRVGRVTVEGETRGRSAKALLESAAFAADVADAALALPDDSMIGAGARIAFAGRVATRAGAAVEIDVKGDAQGTPLTLAGHLAPLAHLLTGSDSQPVDLALALGGTRFEAAGTVSVRDGRERFEGRARLAGPSVAALERVINANLPDLPAYAASASVKTDATRVELDDFTLRLGESTLAGRLAWREAGGRGRLEGRLSGERVRLEDLAAERALAAPAGSAQDATLALDVKTLERDAARLARFVRAFDADLAVVLEDVTAAGAAVGRASAVLRMDGGRLVLSPFALALAGDGGTVRAELAMDARGAAPHYDVHVAAERLEYGPFARAADPKSVNAGTLDLSMRLTSRGTPTELMRRANGTVDLLVVPRGRVSASLVDLWSAGLLQNIWTRLDPGAESRLNCAVGSFDLTEGVLKSRLVLLDTTRVRVAGELEADFGTRKLGGRLAPRAKQPELFNPAPSVRVGGTFERPTVLPSPEALVIGALRLYGFAYAYALDWLTTKNMPADGTPDCRAAYRRARR